MAKLHMQRVYLCALKKDRKAILETLQRLEVVEVRDFSQEDDYNNISAKDDILQKREQVKKNLDYAKESIQIIKNLCSDKVSEPFFLKGRKELDEKHYSEYVNSDYENDIQIAKNIVDNNKLIKEKNAEIAQLTAKLETLEPWENLSVPMNFKGTVKTRFFIGTLPLELTKTQISDLITDKLIQSGQSAKDIPFEIEIVSSIDVLTYFTLVCLKKDESLVYDCLRTSGFIPPVIEMDKTPTQMKKEILEKIQQLKEQVKDLELEISKKVSNIENLRFLLDYETIRLEHFETLTKLNHLGKVFVLKGYVPQKCVKDLENTLNSKYLVEIQFEDTDEQDEDVPVLLDNNGYSSAIEGVIESYSLPGVGDIDPTFAVSIFYYFMFGLMLSDAGYGLIIFLTSAVGLLMFKDNLENAWRKTLRMYLFCGAFTMFWGVMFGSYFGDLIDVTYSTFLLDKPLSNPIIEALWYFPVKDPMRLLTFSLIVGIVHLFTGMFLKALQYAKQKKYSEMFKEVILWYGLLIGCLIILLSTEMLRSIFKYDFIIPNGILLLGKVMAGMSALGIIFTNGSSDNIGVKIAQGLYSLYGISGYLSDVLSYSRLLALGLATGVIASVINMMGSMVAKGVGGIIGFLVFVLIMIFGHLFNLAINALGAYVHTNRLQYVELFGKFYEGGGIKFNPLKMNTKYFKFKESK